MNSDAVCFLLETFCVWEWMCMCCVRDKIVERKTLRLFIKEIKKHLCIYEKVFVFITCWTFFLTTTTATTHTHTHTHTQLTHSEVEIAKWQWEVPAIEITSCLSQYSVIKEGGLITSNKKLADLFSQHPLLDALMHIHMRSTAFIINHDPDIMAATLCHHSACCGIWTFQATFV